MSFLDRRPFDVNDPQARELLEALGNVYPLAQDAYRLLSHTGIGKQDIYFGQPMTDVWLSICETATNRGLLRRLVNEAAKDHRAPGYDIFRALTAIPISDALSGSNPTQCKDDNRSHRFERRRKGLMLIAAALIVGILAVLSGIHLPIAVNSGIQTVLTIFGLIWLVFVPVAIAALQRMPPEELQADFLSESLEELACALRGELGMNEADETEIS